MATSSADSARGAIGAGTRMVMLRTKLNWPHKALPTNTLRLARMMAKVRAKAKAKVRMAKVKARNQVTIQTIGLVRMRIVLR